MREGGRGWPPYLAELRSAGVTSAGGTHAVLEQELGLLAHEALARAEIEVQGWNARGYRLVALTDPDYPVNLRSVEDRPAVLFIAGRLSPADGRSVSVIGTREPSDKGRRLAAEVAGALSGGGYSVFSGLATGIDACAHAAVLARGGRTVAVIGSGLDHSYPRENAQLQARIAREGAVMSQFWPEAAPTRKSFPARNALMSALTLGSVIIEASPTSGTRIQARHALDQGRTVVLMAPVLAQEWARELSIVPGVVVAESVDDTLSPFRD